MHKAGTTLVFSATDVSGYSACPHLTTQAQTAALGGPRPPQYDDPGADVLRQRGHEHEAAIVEAYKQQGLNVREPPKPTWDEGNAGGWPVYAADTLALMQKGVDVIAQACFFDGTWLARPDFLVKVDRPSALGDHSYEVVDAKLARSAKVGAVLQICFYSEMLEAVQGTAPERMHLALGGPDAEQESFRVADYAAYFRSVKRRFLTAVTDRPDTYPEPCTHCDLCDWKPVCKARWHEDDHFSLVAGIARKHRAELELQDVTTLAGLAKLPTPLRPRLPSVSDATFHKIREQARIQLEGRVEDSYKYELLQANPDEEVDLTAGLLALPTPSAGDLFFDIEGDPHAFNDGLEYLLGYTDTDANFTGLWALTPTAERAQFETFIDTVMARLEQWPDMHVYHYAAYEQTAVKKLACRYGTREMEVDRLLKGRVFVDLFRVVRQGLRASVESYSIKKMEPFYQFDREVDLRAASSALANFEAFLQMGGGEGAQELLDEIEGYNKDDCVSTLRLREWLEGLRVELEAARGAGPLPRPEAPEPDPSDNVQEENERVQALMDALLHGALGGVSADPAERADSGHEADQAKWMLAHVLGFHRREKKSMWWEYFRLMELDDEELFEDAKAIAGLEYVGEVEQVKRSMIHRYRFPAQDHGMRRGDRAKDPATDNSAGDVVAVDDQARTIDLKRGLNSEVPHPRALIPFDDVPDKPLRDSLERLASEVVAGGLDGATNRAAIDLLLRRRPRAGQPEGGALRRPGESNLDAACRVALELTDTVLPIQGPPGSGKTYIGARMIVALIAAGKRVGVTANSHSVITNLLDEACRAADEAGVDLRGLQKGSEGSACSHPSIECTGNNDKVAEALDTGEANLAAGTVWLWAREPMADKVDVLFVDEAGQMSLANVLAASASAGSVVLLGDPQQLDQPQKGTHPPGTGASALEHLVGGATLSADRGLFLEETWRLHPDICAFTSELYYEGRLTSRAGLDVQRVEGPTPFDGVGLRFVAVEHEGNSSESVEEVRAVVALVDGLLGAGAHWTDRDGVRAVLGLADVLVVSPYNAQVTALREALPEGARVGTVDKFQGQEAPVVIYSTASSTVQDAPRGMEFVFDPNRLNVATSRAKCLAVMVGSGGLLGADCGSVKQMSLANGFCRFGEMAG